MDNHHQTPTGGVLVPLLQAVITGGLVGLAVGVFDSRFGVLAGALVMAFTWVHLLRKFWALVEHEAGLVEPQPTEPEPRVVVVTQDGRSGLYFDGLEDERLVELAEQVHQGAALSMANFAGAGKLFSRAEFERLRAQLLHSGFLAWKNERAPSQGVQLTRPGQALIRHYASLSPAGAELSPRRDKARE